MCIICVKPENFELSDDILKTMWDNNRDGAGFMYAENDSLNIIKGLMTFNDFLQAYEPHKNKKIVMHFRIRTHGTTDAAMTHPFVVDNNLAFAHNGVISGMGDQTHSDTWYFNERVIKAIRARVQNFLDIDPIKDLLESKVGFSKLVFMDNTGKVDIINESKGDKSSDGVWFSNTSWRPRPTPIVHTPPVPYVSRRSESRGYQVPKNQPYNRYHIQLQIGDYATISSPLSVHAYPNGVLLPATTIDVVPGDPVRIDAFNQDMSVDIYHIEKKRKLRIRSMIYIDKIVTVAYLRKSWGHMKAGKKLHVINVDAKYAECIDPAMDRIYSIPNRLTFITEDTSHDCYV